MLTFRPSEVADLPRMVRIGDQGKELLRKRGVSQWQRGNYPSLEDFSGDLDEDIGYVVCDDGLVVAVCAVTFTEQETYNHLTEGSWITPPRCLYAAVHRVAVSADSRGKGVAGFLFDQAAKLARQRGALSLRVDTHPDNLSMQRALEKSGFVKCGAMILLSGHEEGDIRWGYERVL